MYFWKRRVELTHLPRLFSTFLDFSRLHMVPRQRWDDDGMPWKQRRETHLDEATNQYFYIDEEGASQWADEGGGVDEGEGGGGETKGVEGGQEARRWTMNKEKGVTL